MTNKTIKRISVPNLKSFGPTKTQLRAKKWIIFYYVIWGNGLGEFSCPPSWLPQYKCIEIFQTLNNFCIYWCIDLKLAEIFQIRLFTLCKNFVQKIVNFNFLMTSSQAMNRQSTKLQKQCSNRCGLWNRHYSSQEI